jgi:alpha-beta hydrolase superfamily lysophospholipase
MASENSIITDINFTSDNLALKGILHLPGTKRPPVIIGCHGLFSSADSPKQIALAEECNRWGMAYFRFNHRGCGNSQGDFDRVTSLEARCRDLIAAADAISRRSETGKRLGLFGSSMGGTVCLNTAGHLTPGAMVTFAAPIRSDLTGSRLETSRSEIVFDVARRQFDITERLSALSNILIFHGDVDDVVPVSHAKEIHRLADQPKKLIIQHQGDHPMSNPAHQEEFVRLAGAWFKQGLLRP